MFAGTPDSDAPAAAPVPAAASLPTAASPPTAAPAPAAASVIDDSAANATPSMFAGTPEPPTAPQHRSPLSSVLLSPNQVQGLVVGKDRSLDDVVDKPAEWLARASDYLGITHGAGDNVAAQNTVDRQAYDAQAANLPTAATGRLAGQAALTLPIGGALGQIGRGAGEAVAAAGGRIAAPVEGAINGVNNFLSGTAGGGGGVINGGTKVASTVANGAIQGGTAAAITSGQSDAPVAEQIKQGAETGAIAAPIVKGTLGTVNGVGDALTGGVNPETARLAQLGRDKYGINLRADQISPSPSLRVAGSVLAQTPGSGIAASNAEQTGQVVRAVGKEMGEDVDQITPAVMQRAKERIGASLDDVANQTSVIPAAGLDAGLTQVGKDAEYLTPDQQAVIQKHIANVRSAIDDQGNITGQQYQSLTKMNSALGKATSSSDSDVRNAAIDIKGHLDDALEQSLPDGSPVLQQLKDARSQYKVMKTIEPLVVKGVPGEISPMALQGAVNRSYKGRGLREAQPNLGEIADIAHQFNLVPDSGTAGRAASYLGMAGAGGVGTALMSGDLKTAAMTAGAGAGTLVAGRLGGTILRSPTYVNALLRSGANPNYVGSGLLNSLAPYAVPAAVVAGKNGLAN